LMQDWLRYEPITGTHKQFCTKYAELITENEILEMINAKTFLNDTDKLNENFKNITMLAYFRQMEYPVILHVPSLRHFVFLHFWDIPLRYYTIQKKFLTYKYVKSYSFDMN